MGIASDCFNAKINTSYVSQADIESDFGRSEDVLFQIKV